MTPAERQSLYEKAYRNELSATENQVLDQLLKENTLFKKEYEQFLEKMEMIEAIGFHEQVGRVIKSKEIEKPSFLSRRLVIGFSMAAAVLLGLFLIIPRQTNLKDAYDQYFEVVPDMTSNRNESKPDLNRALFHYNSGEYAQSLDYFEAIESKNDTIWLYMAASALKTEKPEQANRLLNKISLPALQSQKEWYLGLTYLLLEDADSAFFHFSLIKKESSYYEPANTIMNDWLSKTK